MLLRDHFWLWGHPEGCYNDQYGNHQVSRMTPMEACLYLGVRNTFMIPMGERNRHKINRRQYNKSFKTLRRVGWEFGGACKDANGAITAADAFLEDAKDFPNISCVVFDDFKATNGESLPMDDFKKIHDRFRHNDVRGLETWMVLYTINFGKDEEADKKLVSYMECFDGIILWCWEEKDVPLIPEKFAWLQEKLPGKRFMFGCYLWNFGEEKEATGKAVKWQLDWYRERMYNGEAEGVVLHTNTMADLDLEAYDAAIEWMDEHGDEEFPG